MQGDTQQELAPRQHIWTLNLEKVLYAPLAKEPTPQADPEAGQI